MYNKTDLLVCLLYFAAVVAIGFFTGRKRSGSVDGYFCGNKQLPWYAIGLSIVAAGISSEQFVGEMGYAYKLGLPVANWEWLVLPSLSILLWIFVPLYVRNRITTMPEYLERRFGGRARTLYAYLTVASYVLINFALVFYTGGFALEKMWGLDKLTSVWLLALVTGAYTVYGGLTAMAWTSSFQCVLLLGGGLYVFFAGMAKIDWNVTAMLGAGNQGHLFTPADHEVPWTALVILVMCTNVWYYATNQYINQRCLAARNEWHAKMGVLFAGGLQLLIPFATCFPGMIYRVMNPNLANPDEAYPAVVAAVVPAGWRGLVVAAIISAIMSTISGLVNSTATVVTLDIVQRGRGRHWPEAKLVQTGRWAGAIALLIGALFAPLVMKWQSMFRYAQDLWAPMAAPIVVVFLAGALWKGATERGALLCIWLAIASVPFTLTKAVLADANIHFLPANLENSMVFAGTVCLAAVVLIVCFSGNRPAGLSAVIAIGEIIPLVVLAWVSSALIALLVLTLTVGMVVALCVTRRAAVENLWDYSMLTTAGPGHWYSNLGLWWLLMGAILAGIYIKFW
jgi:SSS family solute:Na+ symporter